jgi:putative ABC transport system ATP-binding protein
MSGPAHILRMEQVSKTFAAAHGRVDVLRRVDLAVSEGEFVIMTGPSGSGKSTCLHLAALLDRPSSGTVRFDGEDVSAVGEPELCRLRAQRVGMVFQKYCLLPHRSVAENVAFRFRYLEIDPADARSCVARALDTMDLARIAQRPARLLSGGEMQRVAIARAVAHEPKLLIADEPTGNLDAAAAGGVMDCFRQLNRAGITVLMVTHNEALLPYSSRHIRLCRDGCFAS